MTATWVSVGVALAAWSAPAMAQQSPPPPAGTSDPRTAAPATDADAPGDIVVTAQKREQRLQAVPIAVTLVSGDAVAAQAGVNLENAQYLVPVMNFRKSGTALNQSLFLRGVGTATFSIAGEPSISTVVDGVVYSRAGEAFSDLIDIDRIEVLPGPQGTLFGKNASAGVVNIVTRRPGTTPGGFVEASYFTGDEWRARAAIDLPVSAAVRSRITGFYGAWDGNIRNLAFGGRRVNGYAHWGVRGIVVADATPDLTLTAIADYRRSDDDCCAEVIGTRPTSGASAPLLPDIRGDRSRTINQNLVTATDEAAWGLSRQADWSVGRHVLTAITAYRSWRNQEVRDGDWLPAAYVGLPQLHDVGPQTGDTFSQEVRLASPTGGLLDYVVGGFFSRAVSDRTFTRDDIVCTQTPAPAAGVLVPCTAPGVTVTRPSGTADFGSTFTNYAAFGQATLNLTPSLRVIAGLRYTVDELAVHHQRVTTLAGPGINPGFGPFAATTDSRNLSGRAGVQADLSPGSMLYGTYARGYKGPAYNIFFNLTAPATNVIEPETADSVELGLKNTLFGGKVVLNLAAWYARYRNYQANNPDLVAGVLVTRFTNAGEVSTRGAQLDVIAQPVRDLSISGGLAYTDAKVDRFKLPTNGVATGVIPSGTRLGAAIPWKGSVAVDYRWRTGGAIDVGLGTQVSAQSEQAGQFDASPTVRALTEIPAYTLVNLSAAIIDAKDRFRITAVVKNLFDTSFPASIVSSGPGGAYRYIIPREADRYAGITARLSFGAAARP